MDKGEEKGGELVRIEHQPQLLGFGGGGYRLVVIDGKRYLVRVKDQQDGGISSTGSPKTSMGVQQQDHPLVTQDYVDVGPVKKLKSPEKEPEPKIIVPAKIEKNDFKGTSKEKDGKRVSSSVKKGDVHNDKKSVSSSSSFGRIFFEASAKPAATQVKNDKEDKEEKVCEKIRLNGAFLKEIHHEAAQPNQKSNKDKETYKRLNFFPQMSFEKKLKMGAKVNYKKEEKSDMAKVNLSLGNGSNALVKGMEGGRSVVSGSLKRASTDFVGMQGDAKKAKLDQERSESAESTTSKGKEKKYKGILVVDRVSSKPRKTVSWKDGEDEVIEDVCVFELGGKEVEDIAEEKGGKELYKLVVKLFRT